MSGNRETPDPRASTSDAPEESGEAEESQQPRAPRRRRSIAWTLWAGVTVVVLAALAIALTRPQWYQRAWDATGITCGWGLSEEDAEDFDSPWAGWGAAEHEPAEDVDIDTHRENLEVLAEELDLEPVAELPSHMGGESAQNDADRAEVTVKPQDDQLRVETRSSSDFRRLAVLDPASGDAVWHWDMDESREARIHDQGAHLVMTNQILRGQNIFVGTTATESLSLDKATGERAGCTRFAGSQSYAPSGAEEGLLIGIEEWNPMVDDDEQDNIGSRSVQQVQLPRMSKGPSAAYPAIDYTDSGGMPRSRPHPLTVLSNGLYLTHTYGVGTRGSDDLWSTATAEDEDTESDLVPLEAHDVETGEILWDFGEPGDHLAFVSEVPEAVEDGTGVLMAETGEYTPSADIPDRGSVTMTLRMLNDQGEELWDADTAEIGLADFPALDGERYASVLGDIVVVHTGTHEVSALDAATGELLWSIDEAGDEPQPLWLHQAVQVDDAVYLPGNDREYFVDAQAGKPVGEGASALGKARVTDFAEVGDDFVLVQTQDYGYTLMQRR